MTGINLTPHEERVLTLLGDGKVAKQISAEMRISEAAVYSCKRNIARKARRSGYRFATVLVRVQR